MPKDKNRKFVVKKKNRNSVVTEISARIGIVQELLAIKLALLSFSKVMNFRSVHIQIANRQLGSPELLFKK